jgi:hypothetical protein
MNVVRLYEKVAGRKAKVTRVPVGVLRVMYRLKLLGLRRRLPDRVGADMQLDNVCCSHASAHV